MFSLPAAAESEAKFILAFSSRLSGVIFDRYVFKCYQTLLVKLVLCHIVLSVLSHRPFFLIYCVSSATRLCISSSQLSICLFSQVYHLLLSASGSSGLPALRISLTDYTVAVQCFQERLCVTVCVCTNKPGQYGHISLTLIYFWVFVIKYDVGILLILVNIMNL